MASEIRQIRKKAKLSAHAHNFPIVGIGASAGGLNAFERLLEAVPKDSEMAYVVVQHLSPMHESHLTEILSRVAKIPIQEITDGVPILPNHIYVIPSGKILTTVDGVLKLSPREDVKTNLVIDIFFTSIAVVWESMAVGVVLSGAGNDGTVGLKMIKNHGGITIAQDESAAFGDMPQSAVDANVVDFVLPAEKIPAQLVKIKNTYAAAHALEEEESLPKNDETAFKEMLQVMQQVGGVDFTHYKQSTLHRRIGRRMALHKRGNLEDYSKFLQSDKAEQGALFQDMLISVTSFFRDPKTFETLTEKVFPALLKNNPDKDPIRIWIAGCSNGKEAYSYAISLHEFLERNASRKTIQIFASDISESAIKKARAGIYTKEQVKTLSEEQLNNYFNYTADGYQVNKELREMCVFAKQNFVKDPPFAKMDLISCRNVFIYMDPVLQKKALTTFHYALKENGILVLGNSETASEASALFTDFDGSHKIYSRNPGVGRFMEVATWRREEILTTQNAAPSFEASQSDFRKSADELIISRSPASVIVNEQLDIVHINGNIDPFLKQSRGKPSLNLLTMAREGLALDLRTAINKAQVSKDSVIIEDISIKIDNNQKLVTIEVFTLADTAEPHYLIVFTKSYIPEKEENSNLGGNNAGTGSDHIGKLKKELTLTKEDMISISELMETANEKLKTNNEELQILNEKLESSGEELQSSNEELSSLNLELIDREEQLNAAREYSEAIVSTIKEPLVILDKNLRIKSANNSFYKKFKLSKRETQGNFFLKIQNNQWDNKELRSLLKTILPENTRMEDFEMVLDDRIMLLNAREIVSEINTEQLILLAIEDVTDTKLAKKLKISEAKFRNLIMQAPAPITTFKGPSFIVEKINETALEMWGKTYDEVIDKPLFEVSPKMEDSLKSIFNTIYLTGEPYIANELPIQFKRKGKPDTAYMNVVYQPLRDLDNKIYGIMSIGTEVTESVNARKLIEASELFNRTILESSPDCLKVLDPEGRVQYMNSNGLCQMEIEDLSAIKNKNWWDMWGSENEEMVKASVDKALNGETAQFTAFCPTAKGTPKWWDVVVSPVGNPDEPVQQIISVSRDVTEQKESQDALDKLNHSLDVKNKALENANVELTSFSYIASHDLQEPIRMVKMFTKRILETEKFSEKTMRYFDFITEATERMRNLTISLLDYSRIDRTELKLVPRDLNTSVRESKRDLRLLIAEKQAIIAYENLPTINGLSIQLTQLFTNLISNAIKYSRPEVVPHIKITSVQVHGKKIDHPAASKQQKYYAIKIADNGIGFEEEHAAKIFELFQRLHGRKEYSGTGIGLAIVKKIVTNHNGFIIAKGNPGVGSTFTIYFPTL